MKQSAGIVADSSSLSEKVLGTDEGQGQTGNRLNPPGSIVVETTILK